MDRRSVGSRDGQPGVVPPGTVYIDARMVCGCHREARGQDTKWRSAAVGTLAGSKAGGITLAGSKTAAVAVAGSETGAIGSARAGEEHELGVAVAVGAAAWHLLALTERRAGAGACTRA